MSNETRTQNPNTDVSLQLLEGWHCSHFFYRFDRARLPQLNPAQIDGGAEQLIAILDPAGPEAPARIQTSAVTGHKADFALMMLDADPLKTSAVHQRLMASCLGPAIVPNLLVYVDHGSFRIRAHRRAIRQAARRRRRTARWPRV